LGLSKRAYIGRVLKRTVLWPFGRAELAAGTIAGALPPFVDHFSHFELMPTYSWLVWPFGVAGIFILRLVSTPYRLAKEDFERIAVLEAVRASKEKRDAIRLELGKFLEEGQRLQLQSQDEDVPPPEAEAASWLARLAAYLGGNPHLGPSYVARLNNPHGLPSRVTGIWSLPHRKVEGGIASRLARLEQFLSEIPLDGPDPRLPSSLHSTTNQPRSPDQKRST
jgi:hypothetical protein